MKSAYRKVTCRDICFIDHPRGRIIAKVSLYPVSMLDRATRIHSPSRIDCAGPPSDHNFKPLVLGQNQSNADIPEQVLDLIRRMICLR
jgi:hypothetical protein